MLVYKWLAVGLIAYLVGGLCTCVQAQVIKPLTNEEISRKISQIRDLFPGQLQILEYGNSFGGEKLIALEWIPNGISKDSVPELAIIGGVSHKTPYSREMVLQLAERILEQGKPFNSYRWLFLPNVAPELNRPNPFFEAVLTNTRPYDEDYDGLIDEDGPEDVNKDGFITQMRILDPTGGWVQSSEDDRVLVPKTISSVEMKSYRLYTEGIDNDHDELWNEDATGGVAFDNNFPVAFPWFQASSGTEPLSEPESRALAELLFSRKQLSTVWLIGADDNLAQAWKTDTKQPSFSPHTKDVSVYEELSKQFASVVKLPDGTISSQQTNGGSLFSWLYQHMGFWTLASNGTYRDFASSKDSSLTDAENEKLQKRSDSKNEDVKAQFYAEKHGIPSYYVPWQVVTHPDFPNQQVEIGGMVRSKMDWISEPVLTSSVEQEFHLLDTIVKQLPRMDIGIPVIHSLGANLYRVQVEISISGIFPSHTGPALELQDVPLNRWKLTLAKDQILESGFMQGTFNRLQPGERYKLDFVVNGTGKITLQSGQPKIGFFSSEIQVR